MFKKTLGYTKMYNILSDVKDKYFLKYFIVNL